MSAILTQDNNWEAQKPPPSEFRRSLAPLAGQICERLEVSHFIDYLTASDPIMNHLKCKQRMKIQCFDPYTPRFADAPVPADFVFCAMPQADFDFQMFQTLIDELKRITLLACLFAVEQSERPAEWWLRQFMENFEIQTFQRLPKGFYVIFYNPQDKLVLAS